MSCSNIVSNIQVSIVTYVPQNFLFQVTLGFDIYSEIFLGGALLGNLRLVLITCLLGGKHGMNASPSPKASTKFDSTKKVYYLGDDQYSVFHHKHYRVICQLGTG